MHYHTAQYLGVEDDEYSTDTDEHIVHKPEEGLEHFLTDVLPFKDKPDEKPIMLICD